MDFQWYFSDDEISFELKTQGETFTLNTFHLDSHILSMKRESYEIRSVCLCLIIIIEIRTRLVLVCHIKWSQLSW